MSEPNFDGAKTAIDLFCGAGGLTLGLKQAGFRVVAGVELDRVTAATFRSNHPEVECFEADIRRLGAVQIRKKFELARGELDLLAGCPPCQGFSTLRTRKQTIAVADERNDLLFEFLRLVEALLPKAIMMENVPALARDQRMKRFMKRLCTLGYKVGRRSISVEDAADYGVPQRRRRMIMMASRMGAIAKPAKTDHVTVRQCLETAVLALPGQSGDPLHDFQSLRSARVTSIIKNIPHDGGSRAALPEYLVLPCHKHKGTGFRDVYGRMAWDKVAPTMTGGCGNPSKGRFLHPSEDRAITLREAALFQTFPVDYKFDLSQGRGHVALMIGNALPPEFIRRHALAIVDAVDER